MPNISVCVISFNEEDRIEECLQSVSRIADEIIVVDSGSADRTREIASRYATRLVHQPFLGYVQQKQFSVDQASHDWILSLDCDERVSVELCESILAIKGRLGEQSGWSFNRKNFYLYRWLNHAWYPEPKVRLFNRQKCRWGGVNPHDRVEVADGSIGHLRGDLLHYSYSSLSDHLDKLNKFSDIASDELIKRGRRIYATTPLIHAVGGFFSEYVIKRGFLDGFAGLTVALSAGWYDYVKYAKAFVKQRHVKSD